MSEIYVLRYLNEEGGRRAFATQELAKKQIVIDALAGTIKGKARIERLIFISETPEQRDEVLTPIKPAVRAPLDSDIPATFIETDDFIIDDEGDRWDYFPQFNSYLMRRNFEPGYDQTEGWRAQWEIERHSGIHRNFGA